MGTRGSESEFPCTEWRGKGSKRAIHFGIPSVLPGTLSVVNFRMAGNPLRNCMPVSHALGANEVCLRLTLIH